MTMPACDVCCSFVGPAVRSAAHVRAVCRTSFSAFSLLTRPGQFLIRFLTESDALLLKKTYALHAHGTGERDADVA
jgi:hypothetical protein